MTILLGSDKQFFSPRELFLGDGIFNRDDEVRMK